MKKHWITFSMLSNLILHYCKKVKPPGWILQDHHIFEEIYQGWGTALYAPGFSIFRKALTKHSDLVAAGIIQLSDEQPIFIASIHAPIINNQVFTQFASIFAEIESMSIELSSIIGGDLNSARLAEKVWLNHGQGPFFECTFSIPKQFKFPILIFPRKKRKKGLIGLVHWEMMCYPLSTRGCRIWSTKV